MSTVLHCHCEKAGLVVDVVEKWPESREWIKDSAGERFAYLRDAVQAILDVPTKYLPMGCPTPDDEGKCPGHTKEAP